MFRKFFDPAVAEAKSESKFQVGGPISINEVFEAQRQQSLESKEEINTESKIEEKIEEKKEPVIEEKKDVIEEKKVEPIIEEKKEPITPDWKEFVKKPEHRKEVHSLLEIDEDALNLSKEIAQDEFVKKLVSYRKEHGNVTPFIEAATRDWDKISPENLIMDDLKKQYSHLSSEKAEKLAKSDFNQRFVYKDDLNLSETENQEMAELTALKLESESAKILNLRKTEQKTFLDSVKPVDFNALIDQKVKEKLSADLKEVDEFRQSVETNPFLSRLNAEKKLVFGEKENSFNYTVKPDIIKEQTLDTNKFYGLFWENDKFNFEKWAKVVAYANDMATIEDAIVNHGRSLSTEKISEGLENAKEKTDQVSNKMEKKSLAKAFAEGGTSFSLQEMYGG
jgi:hypothetical protein